MMTAPRCGGHSGLGSGVSSVSRGSLGSGSGLLMAAPPCHQGTPEPAGASSGNTGVTILPVTAENLAKLQKMFSRKWEFVFMQAEAQYKVDKKRDRLERQILDSQERAFWDVHRPVVRHQDGGCFVSYLYLTLCQVYSPVCV